MESALDQIRTQQREVWNKFSQGWKKWDNMVMNFLKPTGDEIIRLIHPFDGAYILDIAAGTGEPGLTIAGMIPNGKVMVTDLAENMIEIAKENALAKGLRNLESMVADASALPFDDNTFDAVSCRMGFMFFPDMTASAKEMARVLKPGGRIAASVWDGPEHNNWVTTIMSVVSKHFAIPSPPAGSPGMFRCAQPGLIAGLLKDSGLKNINETKVFGKMQLDSIQDYWDFHSEVSAPVVAALVSADDTTKKNIKAEVFEVLKKKFPDGKVNLDFSTVIVYGEK